MKETGIIMSGDHPIKVLDGTKTQTRRTYGLEKINENPDRWEYIRTNNDGRFLFWAVADDPEPDVEKRIKRIKCPYGGVGDLLWMRGTFSYIQGGKIVHDFGVKYQADHKINWWKDNEGIMNYPVSPINEKNRPSIHMPRWASRADLEITGLRAERLWDITEEDAKAEGLVYHEGFSMWHTSPTSLVFGHQVAFKNLWDSLNAKKYPWSSNPWVWVISFSRGS